MVQQETPKRVGRRNTTNIWRRKKQPGDRKQAKKKRSLGAPAVAKDMVQRSIGRHNMQRTALRKRSDLMRKRSERREGNIKCRNYQRTLEQGSPGN
mmetsp:Transcript_31808/g.64760  ORF Transcript_31808/g.64760 Transcript_31808/m.64760 type:complete len:96 (+) Transcript_31808:923-1210(+)